MNGGLGRRVPTDFEHVQKYPLRTLIEDQTLVIPPAGTEKSLGLPWWWKQHNQGQEGSCVGFGCSSMMSITNHLQRKLTTGQNITYRYDSHWLYDEAQLVDEWLETPPEEGTSVNAGAQILKAKGHRRVQAGWPGPPLLMHGISAYRWAGNHDEVRAAIYAGLAVAIGVTWYENFDEPQIYKNERWIGLGDLGWVRGGHCLSIYKMSDRRKAFGLMNSWGYQYPPVWLPYDRLNQLLLDYGEILVITDR